MKVIVIFLLIQIFQLIQFTSARPERPPIQPGEVRNWKGQRHFSYDSSKMKRSTTSQKNGNEPEIKYEIDVAENFRSLDDEEEIERVECGENTLDIFSTTDELSRLDLPAGVDIEIKQV